MSKLSVIIPVYNVEKFLRECLDSIANQTLKDIEIICVNDGSTDGSLAILEEYAQKDSRIKIVNKENGGLASARNAGMKAATGDYYAFVDSDDFVEPNTYEEALKNIDKADFVCFGIKTFGECSEELKKSDEEYYKIKYNGVKNIDKKLVLNTDVSACNKIYKKSIIEKNGITFPDGFYYEDAEFFCKYISCSKTIFYLEEYFYNYRRGTSSIMANTFSGSDKAIHHLHIVKHIFDFWKANKYLKRNKRLFIELFKSYFLFAYNHSKSGAKSMVLEVASNYAKIFSKELGCKSNFVKYLARTEFGRIFEPDLPFYKKIFSKRKYPDFLTGEKNKYFYLFGIEIKRGVRKQGKTVKLLKLKIDDTQLLSELKAVSDFAYMPNSGNMGDMLIASATMKWFDNNNLNWYRLGENEIPEVLVYGGGGAWIEEWINDLKPLMDLMKKCKKVIILPSSYNNVPQFVDMLDEHFVVFCRERKSYDYLKSYNTKAKILLDNDMALRLSSYQTPVLPPKDIKKSYESLNKEVSKLNKAEVRMFRKDSESLGHYETDIDISDKLGWFGPYDARAKIDFAASVMLDVVSRFKKIKTDRLHVGIASILSGVDVSMYDNTYGKIKNVYLNSLQNLPNVEYVEKGENK